ncbi:LamG-like jellyroll fold domain-containing protein [Roseofilum sp. Belize Diploria]|uniref:LamG-like jellyroll fold domain-containing protein n=1 Tax=Roseofilum sp. Belize Diploria TaxID=2821501 RepID=UPI001B13F0C8|nr:LamG-like jellyroll fold domain-containing protein [Roseofilum sp. Belize Diploria]MBP0011132.1 hypothetical protein [Roseofilum sp. Belize Diploria]
MSNLQSIARFNGSNNYIQVPCQKELNPAQFTVSCWAKVEGGQGQWRSPVTCRTARGSSALGGYILYAGNNNKWQFWTGNGGWVVLQGADVVLNTWTHVAATYDGSTMKLYINGELSGSPVQSKILINNQYPLRIGAGMTEGSPTYFFNGKIAEVRLWDKARSQEEIQNSMHQRLKGDEQGLVAYWPLNQESGTSAEDKTGKGNPGTLHGATWAQETLDILTPSAPETEQTSEQSVLTFNGRNNYLQVPITEWEASTFSVELWAKASKAQPGYASVISNSNTTQRGSFQIDVGGGYYRLLHSVQVQIGKLAQEWQHLAVTYDGKTVKTYLNGEEKNTKAIDSMQTVFKVYKLGRNRSNNTYFAGQLSEVRIWDRARTAEEIEEGMGHRLAGDEPGLVAYFPLNEGSGKTVQDHTNQDRKGTIYGATWAKETLDFLQPYAPPEEQSSEPPVLQQETLQAIASFNGSNQYIEVPYKQKLNPAQFTVSCWAKVEGGQGQWRSPVTCRTAKGSSALGGYLLYAGNNNKWQFWTGNGGWVALQGADVELNTWTHVAATYDGSTMKLYINGEPSGNPVPSKILINSQYPLRIGAGITEGNPGFFFNGKIAEVRLWDKARSQEEIQELMHQRLTGSEAGLVGYWPLDAGSGTTVTDKSGHGNNGTINGATWETSDLELAAAPERQTAPLNRPVLAFANTKKPTDYVILNPFNSFPAQRLTVELWLKTNHQNSGTPISYSAKSSSNAFLLFDYRSLHPYVCDANINSAIAFNDGQWHHCAMTWDSSTGKVELYKDGEAVFSGTLAKGREIPNGGALILGQEQDSVAGSFDVNQAFRGQMSEVRIWDGIRSPQEIEDNRHCALTGNESGLVLYWPLNEGTGTTVTDKSGHGHNGTTQGTGVTWETSDLELAAAPERQTALTAKSSAITFDGTDDYITIALNEPETEVTHEFWFKTDAPNCGLFSVVKSPDWGGHDRHLYLSSGNIKTRIWNHEIISSSGLNLADNTWHHVAHVFGASIGGQKVYIDGQLVASGTKHTSDFDWQDTIAIAYSDDAQQKHFQGQIAEVRIWKIARSPNEIQQTMHQSLTGEEEGLIGYWPLNDGSGTNNHPGTLHGGTWTEEELLPTQTEPTSEQSALMFDGEDDHIATTLDAQPSALPATTWEAWVKPTRNINRWENILSTDDQGWDRSIGTNGGQFGIYHGKEAWKPVKADINRWQHIAVVYGADKHIKFYKNGTEYVYSGRSTIGSTKLPFHIGRSAWNPKNCFQGFITEVRVWDSARTAADIQNDMNRRLTGNEPGLVGYWPLNEGQGTTGTDQSNQGHDGTINGATWETSDLELPPAPKVEPATAEPSETTSTETTLLTFDGVDDYVNIPTNPTLDLTDNFTIEAWIKPEVLGKRIVDKNIGGKNEGFTFDTYPQNLRFINKGIAFTSRTPLKTGIWQHVAVTFKHEANGAKLYINGEEENKATPSRVGTVTKLPVRLGSQADKLGNLFKGEMAEVRIWNRVRSPEEIKASMNQQLTGEEEGLMAYWPLNEGTGTTAEDHTSHGNTGTVHSGTWATSDLSLTPAPEPEATAEETEEPVEPETTAEETDVEEESLSPASLMFDGIDDYVTIPNSAWETSALSVELWAKASQNQSNYAGLLSSSNNLTESDSCQIDVMGGFYRFYHSDIQVRIAKVNQEWQHLVVTYDGKVVQTYLNGEPQNSKAVNAMTTVFRDYVLGRNRNNDKYFAGELSDVRIWNKALTADEVQEAMGYRLTGDESGLVAYWPLDEGKGDVIADRTGNAQPGVMNGATWQSTDLELSAADEDNDISPEPEPTPKPASKKRIPLDRSVTSITVLKSDEDFGGRPETLYGKSAKSKERKKRKKRKKQSKYLSPYEKYVRKVAKRQDEATHTYVERHKRSNRKKKNGWLKDFAKNYSKSVSKLF